MVALSVHGSWEAGLGGMVGGEQLADNGCPITDLLTASPSRPSAQAINWSIRMLPTLSSNAYQLQEKRCNRFISSVWWGSVGGWVIHFAVYLPIVVSVWWSSYIRRTGLYSPTGARKNTIEDGWWYLFAAIIDLSFGEIRGCPSSLWCIFDAFL